MEDFIKICRECSKENPSHLQFCCSCGENLEYGSKEYIGNQKKSYGFSLSLLIILLLLFLPYVWVESARTATNVDEAAGTGNRVALFVATMIGFVSQFLILSLSFISFKIFRIHWIVGTFAYLGKLILIALVYSFISAMSSNALLSNIFALLFGCFTLWFLLYEYPDREVQGSRVLLFFKKLIGR